MHSRKIQGISKTAQLHTVWSESHGPLSSSVVLFKPRVFWGGFRMLFALGKAKEEKRGKGFSASLLDGLSSSSADVGVMQTLSPLVRPEEMRKYTAPSYVFPPKREGSSNII